MFLSSEEIHTLSEIGSAVARHILNAPNSKYVVDSH